MTVRCGHFSVPGKDGVCETCLSIVTRVTALHPEAGVPPPSVGPGFRLVATPEQAWRAMDWSGVTILPIRARRP